VFGDRLIVEPAHSNADTNTDAYTHAAAAAATASATTAVVALVIAVTSSHALVLSVSHGSPVADSCLPR
jgi:hypothetical protein